MWPWNAHTEGEVYLFHFSRPLGNLDNPRAQAQHYVGFAEDLECRLTKQLDGRGSKIVAAAIERGITFQVFHWPSQLGVEKLIKRTKKTALYCPVCAAAAGKSPRPLPQLPDCDQLSFDLAELPSVEKLPMDGLEIFIMRAWRQARADIVK